MHWRRCVAIWLLGSGGLLICPELASAAETSLILTDSGLNVRALLDAGGAIGYLIIALSVAMVALIVEHLLSIRRPALMPPGLGDDCRQQVAAGQLAQAEKLCADQPSFLGYVVSAGLQESALGYESVEKSMEDAAQEQAARLFRKIEYLSVIGTIAPMLGLMGTVWGMIQAFGEFSQQANPQVADFAPGISHALVTTLMGLCVAIPALSAFAIFRNRIDEYVAETSLLAEHVLQPLKRSLHSRSRTAAAARVTETTAKSAESPAPRTPPPPVARERDQPR